MTFEGASFANDEPPTLIRRRPAAMERRVSARLPIEMDVRVEGAANRFDATIGDLSAGGVFVLTQRTLPVGTQVMLSFTLPNDKAVEVLADVRWQHVGSAAGWDEVAEADATTARGPGLGLSFFCLDPESKTLLERFCVLREALYYR